MNQVIFVCLFCSFCCYIDTKIRNSGSPTSSGPLNFFFLRGDYFMNVLIQSTQLAIFLVKMRWIERKKKIQEWMRAKILVSRASFHIPVPPAQPRRHQSILYLFGVVRLPNHSGDSTWGNLEWGWVYTTAVNWNDCGNCPCWIGSVRLVYELGPQEGPWPGMFPWSSQPAGTVLWSTQWLLLLQKAYI